MADPTDQIDTYLIDEDLKRQQQQKLAAQQQLAARLAQQPLAQLQNNYGGMDPSQRIAQGFGTLAQDPNLSPIQQRALAPVPPIAAPPVPPPAPPAAAPPPVAAAPPVSPVAAPPVAAPPAVPPSASGPYAPPPSVIDASMRVLRGKESSGNYSNVTDAGRGRYALGAYGILDSNIPEWSKQALGYSITPQQFMRDQNLQDQIARYKFSEYANKYGVAGAARAWLAGEGGMNKNVPDRFGTTPLAYGQDFLDKLPAALRQPAPGAIPFSQATPIGAAARPPGAPPQPAPQPPAPASQMMAFSQTPGQQAAIPPAPVPTAPPAARAIVPPPAPPDEDETPPGQPKAFTPQDAHGQVLDNLVSNQPVRARGINGADIAALYRNPLTQPLAQEYLKKLMDPGSYTYQIVGDNLVRENSKTGQVDVVMKDVRPDQYTIEKVTLPDGTTGLVRVKKEGPEGQVYGGQQQDQANANLTGQPFLDTLPPPRALQVKALVEGRSPPPTTAALRSPAVGQLLRDAAQYEPGFDLTLWKARNAMYTSMTSGKIGQNVASFNTAIGHLDTLDKRIDALENTGFTPYNRVANALRATYDPDFAEGMRKFEVSRTAVIDELTRAFRGTGGSVHDINEWEARINAADSPQALHGAVRAAMELLRSRIEAVGEQVNQGMKYQVPVDPTDLLSRKAKGIFLRLGGGGEEEEARPGRMPAGVTPVRITSQAEYDRLPSGAQYLDPNGIARTKK